MFDRIEGSSWTVCRTAKKAGAAGLLELFVKIRAARHPAKTFSYHFIAKRGIMTLNADECNVNLSTWLMS
jgi:hypothetical protein